MREELDARRAGKADGAVDDLIGGDVDADGRGKQILNLREKRSVATAIVEQRLARKRRDQLTGEPEPAAVAPSHKAARAEQLLLRVVTGLDLVQRFKRFKAQDPWSSTGPHRRRNASKLGVAEECAGGGVVPVEVGGLFEEGHDAVDAGELDQPVDGHIVQPGRDGAEREAGADFRGRGARASAVRTP